MAACGTSGPTPSVELDPIEVQQRSPSVLAPVAFLGGCWRGGASSGTTVIEERWTSPAGGVMLGTTRFLRDGEAVGFEFGHIRAGAEGVVYTPYPGGERSPHGFRLTTAAPGRAVFEAPEHDYPRRILYSLGPDGGLDVRIDAGAGDPSPRGWSLRSVPCGGSGPAR